MACHCEACEEHEEHEEKVFGKEFWIKLIRIVFAVILVVLGLTLVNEEKTNLWWSLAINVAAWILIGYDVVFEAVEDIVKEHEFFSEETLMILATVGAFCLRLFGPEHNEFFDAVMVMILFQIGELLEDIATNKSKKAIRNAIGLRASIAHKRQKDGTYVDIRPDELAIGDEVLIHVGEILPADGKIVSGQGSINMSSLTGESLPVVFAENDLAYSGTTLVSGSIAVVVTKEYEDSTVSHILKLVEEGENSKSKGERFVDKFAKWYTPIVIIIALLLAVIPPLFIGINDGAVWERWLYIAISALIISCPCAVVISVPLTYFASLGRASKQGILIKGANLLDKINELKIFATDKTGTLTKGEFKVVECHHENMSESEYFSFVNAAESRSNHPLALAIRSYSSAPFDEASISEFEESAGKGIRIIYQGKEVLVGTDRYLQSEGVTLPEQKRAGTMVFVAIEKCYAGYFRLEDELRAEAKDLISSLKDLGLKTVLLTGDNEEKAKSVAADIGVEAVHAALLPEDKLEYLEQYKKEGSLAFLGDGINDAPSIAGADVGYAMGGIGSDLAMESADVVVMNDDLSKVRKSLQIAKNCRVHNIFNIVFSLLVKAVILILAIVLPGFPLMAAVAADTGLTLALSFFAIMILCRR